MHVFADGENTTAAVAAAAAVRADAASIIFFERIWCGVVETSCSIEKDENEPRWIFRIGGQQEGLQNVGGVTFCIERRNTKREE